MRAPSAQEWSDALTAIGGADDIALLCHVGPDGDALGSMLGLGAALRANGRSVVASFGIADGETFGVPSTYSFLPALDILVEPADFPAEPEVLVTFDTGSLDRLGSLSDRVAAAGTSVVVDHHATNTRYGTVNLVDVDAAATAVLVAEILDRLGLPLTAEVAAPLYTALVTDTGSFKYVATTPSVHELAARLIATGIEHDLISRAIWDTASLAYVRLLGDVCSRTELDPGAAGGLGLVWTTVRPEDLQRHGLTLADVEGVIDVVRTAQEAEVAAVFKGEPETDSVRVSLRSKGAVDLGALCVPLGGGGHRYAAGFTSHGGVEDALDRLRSALATAPHLPT
ncbi:MAG: bifunctional oligoribonuclease/PAP phosphatase NrnA [Frankiaceae bacterium]|nr:bifunctional oligoribonuclease/PAP phosphatase NrnA [Frankiaceae bacterium]